MTRTAAIAFPITVFLAWVMYVIDRTGNGPGLKWHMVPNTVTFAATMVGVAYLVFAVIAGVVVYFTKIRGGSVSAMSVLGAGLVRLLVVFLIAVPVGSALGELYAYVEERAFLKETEAFMSTAKAEPITGDMPLYSRRRWWPGPDGAASAPPGV